MKSESITKYAKFTQANCKDYKTIRNGFNKVQGVKNKSSMSEEINSQENKINDYHNQKGITLKNKIAFYKNQEITLKADSKRNLKKLKLLDIGPKSNHETEIVNKNLSSGCKLESPEKLFFPLIKSKEKDFKFSLDYKNSSKDFSETKKEEPRDNNIDNYFISNFEPVKIILGDVKKNLNSVEKDANLLISKEQKILRNEFENFLKKAEMNFNSKLEYKLKELENMLKSIHSFNQEIIESYQIVKSKIYVYSEENKEMKFKIKNSEILQKSLLNDYKEKIYLRKILIDTINSNKIFKENHLKREESKFPKTFRSEKILDIPNFSLNIKSEKIKSVLLDNLNKIKTKNNKLKRSLKNFESEQYTNNILNRVLEIIRDYKKSKNNKETFNFFTSLKSVHQDSKKYFYTAKSKSGFTGQSQKLSFDNETCEFIEDIKCLIESLTDDELILKEFTKNKKSTDDLNFEI